jgi:serine/threonine protein kinase
VSVSNERVGRYQLLEPIGLGPTGSVSRAKVFGVAGFERQFAIKRFHADLTSQMQIATALSAAARAYGGLEHPRIARMSEFGISHGTTYTAVEYVNGLDALRLIDEVRISNTTLAAGGALALVSQAARAVGYAHGRGLTHLGLSPTNVVITPEGDVKITDFGILSATIGPRVVEVPRLAKRIAYLAPEQISNEATSAATDVFALGVLAYELVTGEKAFAGDTAADIAKAVATQPPSEPSLPRPIVRVIQRCLARSPFERFPDARALADALDAALRVAPVPGTRKDIGAQVKTIVDRLADLHSGELSGILSINTGTANLAAPAAPIVALGAAPRESDMDLATMEFVRPDTHVAGPTPLVGPANRPTRKPGEPDSVEIDDDALPAMPPPPLRKVVPPIPTMSGQLKNPPSTVPGLAPPPISVPSSIPAIPPPLPPMPKPGSRPLVGAVPPPKPGQGPTRPLAVTVGPPERPSETPVSPLKMMSGAPSGSAPAVSISRQLEVPDPKKQLFGALRPDTDAPHAARTDLVIETDPGEPLEPPPSLSVEMEIVQPSPEDLAALEAMEIEAAGPADRPTNEMAPLTRDQLALETRRSDREVPTWQPRSLDEISGPLALPDAPNEAPAMRVSALGDPHERKTLAGMQPSRSLPVQPSQSMPPTVLPSPVSSQDRMPTMAVRTPGKRSKAPILIASVLGVLAAGAGGYVAYDILGSKDTPVVAATPDAPQVAVKTPDAAAESERPDAAEAKPPDAAVAIADAAAPVDTAVAIADAAAVVPVDATKAEPTPSDGLAVTSTPSGARVYLDGADSGVTPFKLPGTPDKHTIVLFAPGHELYIAQLKGSGAYTIPLKEVTPSGGPAGIKVTKCAKDRYYVFLDGKPTGMVCPTERIEVELGNHTIEIYDMVTETRRQFPVTVKDTRLSVRVRVE